MSSDNWIQSGISATINTPMHRISASLQNILLFPFTVNCPTQPLAITDMPSLVKSFDFSRFSCNAVIQ